MITANHFINGAWAPPKGKQYLDGLNPANNSVLYKLARGNAEDIDAAVAAARAAYPAWSARPPEERADFLDKIADGIAARFDQFARAESEDQGKPFALASKMDIPRAILNFRHFAGSMRHWEQESTRVDDKTFNYVLRKSKGVAGLISPWNLPLYLLTWKIAPAIVTGNTVVCKPSEITSLTAHLLTEVLQSVGLPPGVVNMVYGLGGEAGEALVNHVDVPLISFTGGTVTGRKISAAVAPQMKRLSLELGGKNPTLIFADCDREEMWANVLRASFLNQGEICLCGSRIYVEDSFYREFVEEFAKRASYLKVGDPMDPATFMGPLASREHLAKVTSYLELARAEGARFETGGRAPAALDPAFKDGNWLAPTVLTGLPEDSRCVQEEIFGPVVTVAPFRDFEDAIRKANGVKYGLSASVWTGSLKTAHQAAQRLDAGTTWINTWLNRDLRMPFGGTKASGLGREGGRYSLEFFTEATTVCVRYP